MYRKPDKSEIEEEQDPCPFCGCLLPQSQLDCPDCKNTLPYCIASVSATHALVLLVHTVLAVCSECPLYAFLHLSQGRHLVKEEYCRCPNCLFPAILSEFTRLVNY